MKKMSLLLLASFAVAVTVSAQGGFQRRTVEERVAIIHAKMDSAFKLDAAKAAEVDAIFTTYYKDSDKAREEMMAGGGERPSREAMQAKMQPLTEAREKKLKETLPEAQYEIWKKQIEPGLRPQRPQGGGN